MCIYSTSDPHQYKTQSLYFPLSQAPPPPPPPPPMGGTKKFERTSVSPKPEDKPKPKVQPQLSSGGGGGFGPFGFDPSSVKLKNTGRRGGSTLPKDSGVPGSKCYSIMVGRDGERSIRLCFHLLVCVTLMVYNMTLCFIEPCVHAMFRSVFTPRQCPSACSCPCNWRSSGH